MLQESTRKRFEKGQFERRARMEKDDLENLLFRLFERQVRSHCYACNCLQCFFVKERTHVSWCRPVNLQLSSDSRVRRMPTI